MCLHPPSLLAKQPFLSCIVFLLRAHKFFFLSLFNGKVLGPDSQRMRLSARLQSMPPLHRVHKGFFSVIDLQAWKRPKMKLLRRQKWKLRPNNQCDRLSGIRTWQNETPSPQSVTPFSVECVCFPFDCVCPTDTYFDKFKSVHGNIWTCQWEFWKAACFYAVIW